MNECNIKVLQVFSYSFLHKRHRPEPTFQEIDESIQWIEIACGDHHTVALTRNGEVFTWGNNKFGQLGHGEKIPLNAPKRVESLCGITVVKVDCGEYHTAVVTKEGALLTW